MRLKEVTTFAEMLDANPKVEKIITRKMAENMFDSADNTVKSLGHQWTENALANAKLYKRHGSFIDSFFRFGTNKAVIGVGAGPSFHKNKDFLKKVYRWNLQWKLDEQPFVIVASNKMFKPLLELGIQPHFVFLIDAGDALYPQLCEDIPEGARDSILVTGLHVSPKITKGWEKQGGLIRFYCIGDEESPRLKKKLGEKELERIKLHQGGNILNTLWAFSGKVMNSYVFMALGNDLAFKYSQDYEERAKSFYSVGDYRMSILNKRDDAKDNFGWMGFNDPRESILNHNQILYDLEVMGTSRLLWIYKTWIEVQVGLWAEQKSFQYFNCSEGGILGVLARQNNGSAMMDKDNWFLMDELFPKRWFTWPFEKAVNVFLEAREICRQQTNVATLIGARNVGILPHPMAIANSIGRLQ